MSSIEFYRLQGKKKKIPFGDMIISIGFYHIANIVQGLDVKREINGGRRYGVCNSEKHSLVSEKIMSQEGLFCE